MNNYPGKLIVLYGINNLGKSTQAKLLVERLKANGYQSEYIKYAIYSISPSGEMLNDYLRANNPFDLSPREAQIIQALNRTQYQDDLIAKLKAGINIVAEDYTGTGIAWGLGAGVEESFLKKINSHLINEDLVFLFDGERFRQAIENGHKHENNDDLTNKVRWAHLKLREEYNWYKINANLPIETIHEEIWIQTKKLLEGETEKNEAINEQIKKTYNYSGFQAIGEILTDSGKAIPANPNPSPAETKETEVLRVEKTNPEARLPTQAHAGDAGYDLYANDYYSLPPYSQALISTGIKMAIPSGHVGLIWDKSGLSAEGIKTMGGVIDSGYRGEIKVVIKNLSETDFNISPGQKIAQIIIQSYRNMLISEEPVGEDTARAANNFGSSGKF